VATTSYLAMFIILLNCEYHVSVSVFVGLVSIRVSIWWYSDFVMVMLLSVKDLLVIFIVCYGAYLMCVVASVLSAEGVGHGILIYLNE
jgi:hypothetical protein